MGLSPGGGQGWRSVYQRVRPVVYLIYCGTEKGSGFLYHDQRHILTSLAVAGCGRTIWVHRALQDKGVRARLQAYNNKQDIALLEVSRPLRGRPLRFPDEEPQIGQKVAVLGHPYKVNGPVDSWTQKVLSWSLTVGVIGRITQQYLQVNMPLMTGFSGGPLVDKEGHLLGVLTRLGPQGRPIAVVARDSLLNALLQKPTPRKGWPFFKMSVQIHARFFYALGNADKTQLAPTNQELRLDLIFWDQLMLGIFAGFGLVAPKAELKLSLNFGLDLHYRFLMPRAVRPYLNYVSLGLGATAMQMEIAVTGQQKQEGDIFDKIGIEDLFLRITFWGGIRLFTLVGQFSVGVLFNPAEPEVPVLSISWGLGS